MSEADAAVLMLALLARKFFGLDATAIRAHRYSSLPELPTRVISRALE
ncbi:MAG TPA: hypothetical protein VFS58_16605 [Steroidobacteraceae bacterium]|nr:hypothetical protein [Steroidobacteraceae bacterium]